MNSAEARIMTLLEAAESLLRKADIACDAAGIGPFRHRIHALELDVRRALLDGYSDISKRPRKVTVDETKENMTLPFNPLRAADLARQALDDNAGFDGVFAFCPEDEHCPDRVIYTSNDEHEYVISDSLDANVAEPVARMLNRHREMAEQLMAAVQEVEETRAQLSGAEAASTATRTHSDARDLAVSMASFIASIDKSSGDVADYIAEQLRPLISRANWHEAASTAGKQKLIEHALSKVCCKGEPHTCDQEAIATAEGKTDRLIAERDTLRASCEQLTRERDELRMLCRDAQLQVMDRSASYQAATADLAKVNEALSAAKVALHDEDGEYSLDERISLLARDRDRWFNHSYRLDAVEMEHASEVLSLRQQLDEARGVKEWANDVRLAAKFAKAMPREDEIDSVMSLLSWARTNHDADSAARQWLERVIVTALSSTHQAGTK